MINNDELIEKEFLKKVAISRLKKLLYEIAIARVKEMSELIIFDNINLKNLIKKRKKFFRDREPIPI